MNPINPLTIVFLIFMSLFSFLTEASTLKVGDLAPDFTRINNKGESITLSKFKNKKSVVLYFYPKDNTPGCTAQACSFRDAYDVFKKEGAEVIGVSSDDDRSHDAFAAKYHLPFGLISDSDQSLRKLYGVGSTLGVIPGRVTFVIDKKGIIQLIFSAQMKATQHIEEAIKIIKTGI